MPRRTHKRSTYKRPTSDPAEKAPTYDQLAFQLVVAGHPSPRILGPLHPRVDITHLPDEPTDTREKEASR